MALMQYRTSNIDAPSGNTRSPLPVIAAVIPLPALSRVKAVRLYFDSVNCNGEVRPTAPGVSFTPAAASGFVNTLNSGPGSWPDGSQWNCYADFVAGGGIAAAVTVLFSVSAVYYPAVYYVRFWGADIEYDACIPIPQVSLNVRDAKVGEGVRLIDMEPKEAIPYQVTVENLGACSGEVTLSGLVEGTYNLKETLNFRGSFNLIDEAVVLEQTAEGPGNQSKSRVIVRPANFVSIREDRFLIRSGLPPTLLKVKAGILYWSPFAQRESLKVTVDSPIALGGARISSISPALAPLPEVIDVEMAALEHEQITANIMGAFGRVEPEAWIIINGEIIEKASMFKHGQLPELQL